MNFESMRFPDMDARGFYEYVKEWILPDPIIRQIEVKNLLTKSNLPMSDYSVNPYVGCTHACKYCYASFMKRFTRHPELMPLYEEIYTHGSRLYWETLDAKNERLC